MKFTKLLTVIFIAVFAVSIQSEAGIKKELKKPGKEEKKSAADSKYDYVMKDDSDMNADIKKILPPKSEITHRITEGVFGPADGTKGSILIVPYITGENGKVQLMLLIPAEKGKYKKMMMGEIKFGANTAGEVLSVFFDQADKDKERELFVLCSYYKGDNNIIETAVYDFNKNKSARVPSLESKIKNQYPTINVRRVLRAMENKTDGKKMKKRF